jgi:hypothetical protein
MSIVQKITRESVLITGLVASVFGMLVAFDVPLNNEQSGSIMAFIGVVMMLLRALVTPSSEVVAAQKPGQDIPQAGPKSPVPDGTDVVVMPAVDAPTHRADL